jgi:hypothetical protein
MMKLFEEHDLLIKRVASLESCRVRLEEKIVELEETIKCAPGGALYQEAKENYEGMIKHLQEELKLRDEIDVLHYVSD